MPKAITHHRIQVAKSMSGRLKYHPLGKPAWISRCLIARAAAALNLRCWIRGFQWRSEEKQTRKGSTGLQLQKRQQLACAVIRRRFSSGCKSHPANSLQPEATGAVMEVTKWLKAFG